MTSRAVDGLLISVWIGVCAAVPEVLWQGARALLEHGNVADLLVPSILIGAFLTFFVEPLIERIRAGTWIGHDKGRSSIFVTIAVAFSLGLITVCLHECIAAVMHSKTGLRYPGLDGPREALRIAIEWAFIPACLSLAWLSGARDRRLGCLATVLAIPLLLGVTLWTFRWTPFEAVTSTGIATVTSLFVILWPKTMLTRAGLPPLSRMAVLAGISFTLCLTCLAIVTELVAPQAFGHHAYRDDVLFYLGWVLGLCFAPAPSWITSEPMVQSSR